MNNMKYNKNESDAETIIKLFNNTWLGVSTDKNVERGD